MPRIATAATNASATASSTASTAASTGAASPANAQGSSAFDAGMRSLWSSAGAAIAWCAIAIGAGAGAFTAAPGQSWSVMPPAPFTGMYPFGTSIFIASAAATSNAAKAG